jgi:hypothetical protein
LASTYGHLPGDIKKMVRKMGDYGDVAVKLKAEEGNLPQQ